ncbi:hypothetical protein NLJ89_g5869 [Agrocybe chaxingu]|uniref:Uncharacterized protein n=1 Tax=Agrocybe chaxingu TaxID=84603 RepID=A0A9W8K7K6_9AGAR|nr:hypothetical protein NLJ89_g5869 [Agrocybe chaxingu]
MQFKRSTVAVTKVLAFLALATVSAEGKVLTVERIFHTIVSQSPFLVDETTTVSWTQSASLSTTEPTAAPTPTIDY